VTIFERHESYASMCALCLKPPKVAISTHVSTRPPVFDTSRWTSKSLVYLWLRIFFSVPSSSIFQNALHAVVMAVSPSSLENHSTFWSTTTHNHDLEVRTAGYKSCLFRGSIFSSSLIMWRFKTVKELQNGVLLLLKKMRRTLYGCSTQIEEDNDLCPLVLLQNSASTIFMSAVSDNEH
jgi:hypothetical protein